MKFKDIKLEVKDVGDSGVFEGYAAAFNNEDLGGDVIMPGAFSKTIAENSNRPLLWHHNTREPIGVTRTVGEDAKGLPIEGKINLDVQRGREVHSLMKQGAVRGLSIGYDAVTKEYKGETRMLKEIKLYEISLVPFPMNTQALVTNIKTVDELDSLLQEILFKGQRFLIQAADGGHLPYTDENGNIDHRLMGAAWAALHGGYRGNKYEGPGKLTAIAKLKRLYAQEGMTPPSGKSLQALEAADDEALQAATQDDDAPGILHATSDRIVKLLSGE